MNDIEGREIIKNNNDKSGKMFREKYLKNNYIELYNIIINYCETNNLDLSFKEKVYHFYNDIKNIKLCEECNNPVKFKNSTIGYYKYCSKKCSDKSEKTKQKRKDTCLKKFGSKTPAESEIILSKMINTNIEKYGYKSPLQNNEIKKKAINTLIENYNVKNPLQNEKIYHKMQTTKKEKYKDKNYNNREKFKNTMISLYHVEHALQNKNIKEKSMKTLNKSIMEKFLNFYPEYDIINMDLNEKNYTMKCNHGHIFNISYTLLAGRRKTNTIICTKCNPIDKSISGLELELLEFIKNNYDGKIITSDRKVLDGKELDIYLPDLNLAFEFNGLYYHNELHKDKKYHLNKTEKCEEQGIHLFHIYEDDWTNKKDIIKSMILNKLKKTKNKIWARKTKIEDLSDKKNNKLIRDFLDKNHLQGFVGAKVKLGLFYGNKLVSLMTFGKNRLGIGKLNNNDFELLRFCNILNTNVIGGASKLFKYFVNIYKPHNIISYADRSYSNGNLYVTLNFILSHKTRESYHYIVDKIRYHRFNFRKSKLKGDKNKTEHEIMNENNIFRIYNSGHMCFIWNSH